MANSAFKSAQAEYLFLKDWLFNEALPLWSTIGRDHTNGGFYEKIDRNGCEVEFPRRTRLVSRQIYSFSTAGKIGWSGDFEGAVRHGWEFLRAHCFNRDGTVITSKDVREGKANTSFDLYDHAFALFGMSSAAHALEEKTEIAYYASHCLSAMIAGWKHGVAGFEEGNPPQVPLRSNPHMHLFEAFLAWEESDFTDRPELWSSCLDEVGELCLSMFISPENGAVREYYRHDWSVMPEFEASPIEPGHQFEWAWLLARWGKLRRRKDALLAALRLVEVGELGVDRTRGMAINGLNMDLSPRDSAFRLWPQTERIKAWLMMAEIASTPEETDAAYMKVAEAAASLKLFLTAAGSGLWVDRYDERGRIIEEDSPASSLYHIVCSIEEMHRKLEPCVEDVPALFLDRDGVIIEDTGYLSHVADVSLIPGAAETIRHFRSRGYRVFIVTNQSGIGRGYFDEVDYAIVSSHVRQLLLSEGAEIDDERMCPFHEHATMEKYRSDHSWRKPKPGMIEDIIAVWKVDRGRSLLIGDKLSDVEAAEAANIRGELFLGGNLYDFITDKKI